MAFTDHSDVYVAILDAGANRFVRHLRRQRPSLFNYGTAGIRRRPELLCADMDIHPVVLERGNPILGLQQPLPVFGTLYGLDYCVQLTAAELDFHPGNIFTLPPELTPLGEQRFAIHAAFCAGLACPSQDVVRELPYLPAPPEERSEVEVVIPTGRLTCFCLDIFAEGDIDFVGMPINPRLHATSDGIEIVDLSPVGLENSLECYAQLVLQLSLLPRLGDLPALTLTQALMNLAQVTVAPAATSAVIPHNPSIAENQLKAFIDLTFAGPPGGGGGGDDGTPGPELPPYGTPFIVPRSRTGPADITAAIAETAVKELFDVVVNNFAMSTSGGGDFGPFSLSYAFGFRLDNGDVDLRNDGTISVDELDIVYDPAEVCFGIDIPGFCVGGFCIIPWFDGCAVRAPEICVFEDDPDIEFCLDLGGLLTSELSATFRPLIKYAINTGRTVAMNDWDAYDADIPNIWQLLIDPETFDIDIIDVADTVGNILDAAIEAAVDNLLFFLPDWAKDLVKAALGPVVDLIRGILDLGDDLEEWITEQIGVNLGVLDLLGQAILEFFGIEAPLAEIPDPLPVLEDSSGLIPVMMPIEYLGVTVNSNELIVEADIRNP